jgi:hypothetical protein
MKRNRCPHPAESTILQLRKARNEMMLPDILFTLFLTHVGNLTTVKNNQRRFAPTPAHITGIKCPHHRNTHLAKKLHLQTVAYVQTPA